MSLLRQSLHSLLRAVLLLVVLWAGTLLAAEEPSPARASSAADTSVIPDSAMPAPLVLPTGDVGEETYATLIIKLTGGLALVVLLAWGGVYLMRRLGLAQSVGAAGGPIRLGQRAYLGPKKLICLVEIGDRTLALGVTEHSITPLAEWRAGELAIQDSGQSGRSPAGGFAAHLRALLGQHSSGAGGSEGGQG
jgi:flagellar biogenesis protein FliO